MQIETGLCMHLLMPCMLKGDILLQDRAVASKPCRLFAEGHLVFDGSEGGGNARMAPGA